MQDASCNKLLNNCSCQLPMCIYYEIDVRSMVNCGKQQGLYLKCNGSDASQCQAAKPFVKLHVIEAR